MRYFILPLAALLLYVTPCAAFIAPDPEQYGIPAPPMSELAATTSTAPVSAARSVLPAAPDTAFLAEFQRSALQTFEVGWDPSCGLVRQLAAGRTRAYAGAPQEAARAFLRDARRLLGPVVDGDALGMPVVVSQDWGHQVTFQQQVNGIPVVDHAVTVSLNTAGEVILVDNAAMPLPGVDTTPGVSALRVAGLARGRVTAQPALAIRAGGMEPRLVWRFVEVGEDRIPVRVTVDANSGHQIERVPLVRFSTGQGLLYPSNPTATPTRQVLPLTSMTGDGTLTGNYAKISLIRTTDGVFTPAQTAVNTGLTFNFAPDTEELSQTQAYYGISHIHDWFKTTFNFAGRDHPIPGFVRSTGLINAYFSAATDLDGVATPNGHMVFGYGASSASNPTRDYALDNDVLYHEYSHAMMDVLSPQFGQAYNAVNAETGGMNEGNADYFSSTVLSDPLVGEYTAPASGAAYFRDLTTRLHYPEEVWYTGTITANGTTYSNVRRAPEVHQTGAVWGAALWDLRTLLGGARADQLVFKATSLFTGTSTFQSALGAILTADDLLYGGVDKPLIRDVFAKRGITDSVYPVSYVPYDAFYSSTGPSKINLGWPYTTNGYAYIRPVSPLPSYNAGENYFFTGYVFDATINTVALVLKDASDALVAKITAPIASFNAYGQDGGYYRYLYFWWVGSFPTSLIPEGQTRRSGLRLSINSYTETRDIVDANFGSLTPKAAAPSAGTVYPAELILPQVTPPVFSPSLGDTDGNGRIQMHDALLVMRAISGKTTLSSSQKARADVALPQNGSPDLADARVILQRAGGLL
jgi:Zn-dependent metalloprotease